MNEIHEQAKATELFYDFLAHVRNASTPASGRKGTIAVPVVGSLFYVESKDKNGNVYHHFEPETGAEGTMSSELKALVMKKLAAEDLQYVGAKKVASVKYMLDVSTVN